MLNSRHSHVEEDIDVTAYSSAAAVPNLIYETFINRLRYMLS